MVSKSIRTTFIINILSQYIHFDTLTRGSNKFLKKMILFSLKYLMIKML